MKVHIVGLGPGNPDLLTGAARAALAQSQLLVGSRRMLDAVEIDAEKVMAITQQDIQNTLLSFADRVEIASVVVSGDVGFYSAALGLGELPFSVRAHCGISTLQYLCALAGTGWHDVKTVSLHGREQDLEDTARFHAKIFVLTSGASAPGEICARLCHAGLGDINVLVGEDLSYPTERLTRGTARELAGKEFAPLNALLLYNPAPAAYPATHGMPDRVFARGGAPMSKEEVRALSIARLRLRQGMCVWDVGAGTGSVAVEIARVLRGGMVWAVERDPEAARLLLENRARFSPSNLRVVEGEAPETLWELPAPDAVFIGGSGGELEKIMRLAVEKNSEVRLVVTAIMPETAAAAAACMHALGLNDFQMTQLSAAQAKQTGGGHLMLAQNPVYVLSAGGKEYA